MGGVRGGGVCLAVGRPLACIYLHWNSFNTEPPGSDWDCGLRATLCPLCQLMV